MQGLGKEEGQGGGRRARAARQEARSHRLVTARLGAHGCAGETGGQAAAQLSRLPGPRRRGPYPHPRVRLARLSGTLLAEIHLSVQGQDRNCKLSLVSRKFFIDKVLHPPPRPRRAHSPPTPARNTALKQNQTPARAAGVPTRPRSPRCLPPLRVPSPGPAHWLSGWARLGVPRKAQSSPQDPSRGAGPRKLCVFSGSEPGR